MKMHTLRTRPLRCVMAVAFAIAFAAPAPAGFAAERHVSEPCRAAMNAAWPAIALPRSIEQLKDALSARPALQITCSGDREALLDLGYRAAQYDYASKDDKAALAELDALKIMPAELHYASSIWLRLAIAEQMNDAQQFRATRDAFLAAHDAAMLAMPGTRKVEHFRSAAAEVDAYATANPAMPFVFVANPLDGGTPATMVMELKHAVSLGEILYGHATYTCTGDAQYSAPLQKAGDPLDYAAAKASALKAFSGQPEAPGYPDDVVLKPFGKQVNNGQPCSHGASIAPAFGEEHRFYGTEYAPPRASP